MRGRDQPFPVHPAVKVHEDADTANGEPYYPQKLTNPNWDIPRQRPPPPSLPAPSRRSIGASSYASSNLESEIEAIEALYHEVGGDRPDEDLNHADVDSVFGDQPSSRESGYYEREPPRSNDEGLENGRLSKPIRIPLDEDDYVSPTGGYLDMDSDLEDDYATPNEEPRPSIWDRQSFVTGSRNGESRSRPVRNVEALYRKDGRDRPVIDGVAPPVSVLAARKSPGFF